MRRHRPAPPTLITSAPESQSEELGRRQRRYLVAAIVFVASFVAAEVLHRDTAIALVLCFVAMATLVFAVVAANVRLPDRRPAARGHIVGDQRRIDRPRRDRPPER